tara:strand:+ start:78 stop:722 length:645 start_codon:yes stop_codon:yes gene_type:complete
MILGNKMLFEGMRGPILFVKSGTSAGTVSTSVAVPYPATPVSGNMIIAIVYTYNTASTPAAPTGWTLGGTNINNSALGASVYYKTSDGSETGSVTFTGTGGESRMFGSMVEYEVNYGVAGGFDIDNSGLAGTPPAYQNPNLPTVDNSAYICFMGNVGGSTSTLTLGNYTNRINVDDGLNNQVISDFIVTSSTTDDGNISQSASGWYIQGGFIIR